VDPAHLDAHATVDLSLRAEARAFLEDLSQRAPQAPRDARLRARIAKGKRKHAASLSLDLRDDGVQPEVLFSRLRSRLGADAVLVTDTGRHALWALHAFPVLGPRTLISPADFAARGFAVPAAIGARLAAPERAVVCVCSDTAFMVTGLELKTAADARLALSVLVLEEPPETSGPDHRPVPQAKDRRAAWRGVDFRALAQALGARTATANSDFDLDRALDAALSPGDRPTLCHVRIRYDRST
jgi:acetolactate synthase-1/2/3 large subunit